MEELFFYSLGGIGDVNKSLYVYETEKDLIIVDCGVGFPDTTMLGVDLLIPDISYLLTKKHKIRGIILTHAHEDHIGALPYLWGDLRAPLFATKLTAGFIANKFRDFSLSAPIKVINPGEKITLGDFTVDFVRVNHSVPDATHLIINTPYGKIYHGSDFKFDLTPLDGKVSDFGKIASAGDEGILCLMSDCLRSERSGYTLSERIIEEQLDKEISLCQGKFMVTALSSDIYRWQMVINVAKKHHRKVVPVGRSVEQAIVTARRLGYLNIEQNTLLDSKQIKSFPAEHLCILISGSQGQAGSALNRVANNDHQHVKIREGDVVVVSADPIPGNENAVHIMIDALTKLGASVSYSEVDDDLHVSGHAASQELMLLMALTKPKFLIPIGGTYRQMKRYLKLAEAMGHKKENVFLLESGQQVIFKEQKATLGHKIELKNVLIDGLGVGDVENIVLRDRQQMAKDGVVIVVVSIASATGNLTAQPEVLFRGFIHMKESEKLINESKHLVKEAIKGHFGKILDWQFIRKKIESTLGKFFWDQTARHPMVLSVIIEV
ncbi:ribonuclease J [Candidatus Gottesmanbacteria bacterium]|nr:ribonuclease J [Candidatus Gottesmanbacteria bacterium]